MTHSTARRSSLLATLALLLLQSCFTMGLWGFELGDQYDPITGEFVYNEDTEWSWRMLGVRLVLTPFALGLDCLTMPVQAFFFGDDDDDEPFGPCL